MRHGYLSALFPRKRPAAPIVIEPPPPPAPSREELAETCRQARDTLSWAHRTTPGATLWAERLYAKAEAALEAHDRAARNPHS